MNVDPNLIHLIHDERFLKAFYNHIQARIDGLKDSLVMAEGLEVPRLQGSITELRRLLKLKETVLAKRD